MFLHRTMITLLRKQNSHTNSAWQHQQVNNIYFLIWTIHCVLQIYGGTYSRKVVVVVVRFKPITNDITGSFSSFFAKQNTCISIITVIITHHTTIVCRISLAFLVFTFLLAYFCTSTAKINSVKSFSCLYLGLKCHQKS